MQGQVLGPSSPGPTPTTTPTPATEGSDDTIALVFRVSLLVVVAILVLGFLTYFGRIRPKKDFASRKNTQEPPSKPKPVIYDDYTAFQSALKIHQSARESFENKETARIASLEKKIKESPIGGFILFGSILGSCSIGAYSGAGMGWTAFFVGLVIAGAIMSIEKQFRRGHYQTGLVRRTFDVHEPVYEPPQGHRNDYEESGRQSDFYWKHRTPPEKEPSTPASDDIRVTSLRQAYEILGLPPGRITLEAAKVAYKARMLEYHPDLVSHLGPGLRELAARKALFINLAMSYFEANCK